MQYSFPWWRFCAISFDQFAFQIQDFYYILKFKIFWSLYFKSLRLINTRRVSNQERSIIIKRQFNVF